MNLLFQIVRCYGTKCIILRYVISLRNLWKCILLRKKRKMLTERTSEKYYTAEVAKVSTIFRRKKARHEENANALTRNRYKSQQRMNTTVVNLLEPARTAGIFLRRYSVCLRAGNCFGKFSKGTSSNIVILKRVQTTLCIPLKI